MEAREEKNNFKMYGSIFFVVIIIWLIFMIIIFWSANNFKFEVPPSTSLESLGVFGDSFNILTSLFTGLAFAGVIISVILQTKELEATRKEFSGQKVALENQQKEMVQQSFDNKFFQILRNFNDIRKSLIEGKTNTWSGINYDNFFEYKRISLHYAVEYDRSGDFNNYIKSSISENSKLQYYFINLYQILKYIDKYYSDNYENAKFYTNIVRAQLTKEEQMLLFYHVYAIQEDISNKYKSLVEKYIIFEHLTYMELLTSDIRETTRTKEIIDKLLLEYDSRVFGKSQTIKNRINELR